MKYTLTLLLIVAMAFSSCKKDEKEDIKKEEPKTLAQTIVGNWKLSSQSLDLDGTIMGFPFKFEQRYLNINVTWIFKSDNTFTNSGSADFTSKLLIAGQVVEEDSGNEEFEDMGTYSVISDTKLKMTVEGEEIEFDVISFSDTKIELSGQDTFEEDGETVTAKVKQVFTK